MKTNQSIYLLVFFAISLLHSVFADGGNNPALVPPEPPGAGVLPQNYDGIIIREIHYTEADSNGGSEEDFEAFANLDRMSPRSFEAKDLYASNNANLWGLTASLLSLTPEEELTLAVEDYFGDDGAFSTDGFYQPNWLGQNIFIGLFTTIEGQIWTKDHYWWIAEGDGYQFSPPTPPEETLEVEGGSYWFYDQVYDSWLWATSQSWKDGYFYSQFYDEYEDETGWFWYAGRSDKGLREWYSNNTEKVYREPVESVDLVLTQFSTTGIQGTYMPVRVQAAVTLENGITLNPEELEVTFKAPTDVDVAFYNSQYALYGGSTLVVPTNVHGEATAYLWFPPDTALQDIDIKTLVDYRDPVADQYYRTFPQTYRIDTVIPETDDSLLTFRVPGNFTIDSGGETGTVTLALVNSSDEEEPRANRTIRIWVDTVSANNFQIKSITGGAFTYTGQADITTDSDGEVSFTLVSLNDASTFTRIFAQEYDTANSQFRGERLEINVTEYSKYRDGFLLTAGDAQVAKGSNELKNPLQVKLFDHKGIPMSGEDITFTIIYGNALIGPSNQTPAASTITLSTNSLGEANASLLLTGVDGDHVRILASVADSWEIPPVTLVADTVAENTDSGYSSDYQLQVLSGYALRTPPGDFSFSTLSITAYSPTGRAIDKLSARFSAIPGMVTFKVENDDQESSSLTLDFSSTGNQPSVKVKPDASATDRVSVFIELLDQNDAVVDTLVIPISISNDFASESVNMNLASIQSRSNLRNQILHRPLIVRVTDMLDDPIANAEVVFAIESGNGLFYGDPDGLNRYDFGVPIMTDNDGYASLYFAPIGPENTTVWVSARAWDPDTQELSDKAWFSAIIQDPADVFFETGPNAGRRFVIYGQPDKNLIEIEAIRLDGSPVNGIPISFEVLSAASNRISGQLSRKPYLAPEGETLTVTTDRNGRAKVFLSPDAPPEVADTEFIVQVRATTGHLNLPVTSATMTYVVRSFDTGSDTDESIYDGLPDWWERSVFGTLAETAEGDPDWDGLTNIQEYLLQTNPLDGSSETLGDTYYLPNEEDPELTELPAGVLSSLESSVSTTANGAMEVIVPLPVIPGIHDMQPEVALKYNSQQGNSIMGMGWSLSGLSSITRGPRTPLIDGYARGIQFNDMLDAFYFDGNRLILVEGTAGVSGAKYRTEIDSQQIVTYLIESGREYFEVEAKSGLRMIYGLNYDARYYHGNQSRTSGYLLQAVYDAFGNYMTYEYIRPSTMDRPMVSKILYTGNDPSMTLNGGGSGSETLPTNEIFFDYERRPDVFFGYSHGYEAQNRFRLASIQVKGGGTQGSSPDQVWRTYSMRYEQSSETDRTLLMGIVTKAADGTFLLPTAFSWSIKSDQKGWISEKDHDIGNANGGSSLLPEFIADYNQDGIIDIMRMKKSSDARWYLEMLKASADGLELLSVDANDASWADNPNFPRTLSQVDPDHDGGQQYINTTKFFQGDFNGDGFTDICKFAADNQSAYEIYAHLAINDGYGGLSWSPLKDLDFKDPNGVSVSRPTYDRAHPYIEADYNADGYTDILSVEKVNDYTINLVLYYFQPDGSIVVNEQIVSNVLKWTQSGTSADEGQHWRVGDFDGDGLMDLLRFNNDSSDTQSFEVFLNRANGSDGYSQFVHDKQSIDLAFDPGLQRLLPGDVNGDGLTDLIFIYRDAITFYVSKGINGTGGDLFVAETPNIEFTHQPEVVSYYDNKVGDWRLGDFYGDGYVDLFQLNTEAILDNEEAQLVIYNLLPPSLDGGFRIRTEKLPVEDFDPNIAGFHKRRNGTHSIAYSVIKNAEPVPYVADFSGDNKSDLFLFLKNGSNYEAHRWGSLEATTTDIISGVTNGLGVQTKIVYAPLSNVDSQVYTRLDDAPTRLGGIDITNSAFVVESIFRDTGLGTASNPEYSQHEYYYTGLSATNERGVLGFRQIQTTDTYGNELTTRTTTTYSQTFPYIGAVDETVTEVLVEGVWKTVGRTEADVDGRAIKTIWQSPGLASKQVILPVEQVIEKTSYELDGALVSKTRTETLEADTDEWGNIEKITEIVGQVADLENAASDTVFKTTTVNEYGTASDDEYKRFGRLTKATVTKERPVAQHGDGTNWTDVSSSVRSSAFTYNADTLVLQSEIIEPDATGNDLYLKQTTTYTYDTFGNITNTQTTGNYDPGASGTAQVRGVTDTYTVDARFVEQSQNALSHTSSFTYDELSGSVLTLTDSNSLLTVNTYDSFDRLMKVDVEGSAPAHTRRMRASDVTDGPPVPDGAFSAVKTWSDAAVAAPQVVFYDRLGRVLRSATVAGDGAWVMEDTEYGMRGLVSRTSRVYKLGTTLDGVLDYASAYYDPLGRVLLQTSPGGGALGFSYAGTTTTQFQLLEGTLSIPGSVSSASVEAAFGALTREFYTQSSAVTDVMGQTIYVQDNAGLPLFHYYDANMNLISTAKPKLDANGFWDSSAFTFNRIGYDSSGNKWFMTDPDMGTWFYTYNSFGELTHQQDAMKNLVYFEYDLLGRSVLRQDFSHDGTNHNLEEYAIWVYDTATNGVGLLHAETVYNASATALHAKSYTYDTFSRLATETEVVSGNNYTFTYDYDPHGRLSTTEYPQGVLTTRQNYGSYGEVKSIEKLDAFGASLGFVWEADGYDSTGSLNQFKQGNGLITRLTRDQRRGFLQRIQVGDSASTAQVQDHEFTYDVAGSLLSREDHRRSLSETLTYDALRRLDSVQYGTASPVTIGYDPLGNIRSKHSVSKGIVNISYFNSDNEASGSGIANADIDGGPNAVSLIEYGSNKKESYQYDDNGRLVKQEDTTDSNNVTTLREYTWTIFNKPKEMKADFVGSSPTTISSFSYGAGRQRTMQVLTRADGSTKDLLYVAGGLYEKEINDPDGTQQTLTTLERAFVPTPTGNAAVILREEVTGAAATTRTEYLHYDHQGSLSEVTNQAKTIIASYSYDAWGEQRDPDDWSSAPDSSATPEEDVLYVGRGYTGHEPLQDFGLVHMNGRIYDPVLGRFLSADPFVQFTDDLQSHNRYSYVLNSPLTYTDPSGYFIGGLFDKIGDWFSDNWQTVVGIAVGATIAWAGPSLFALIPGIKGTVGATYLSALVGGAAAGGISGSGRGAISGAVFGVAFWGIGTFYQLPAGESLSHGQFVSKTVAHGVVGGTQALAFGGEFHQGFLAAGLTHAFSGPTDSISSGYSYLDVILETSTAATIGGTASVISGGSFANGAVTGSFSHLYNSFLHSGGSRAGTGKRNIKKSGDPHLVLDAAGMIPGIGIVFDLANATLYLIEGDLGNAALSAGSAVPIAGQYVTGAKYATVGVGVVVATKNAKKVPLPTFKDSPFGPKIADPIPSGGVPKNWTAEQINDAIIDYRTSIFSRKLEVQDFDLSGAGTAFQRAAHTRRIAEEEQFLHYLEKAAKN